jgi:hypothetical protein
MVLPVERCHQHQRDLALLGIAAIARAQGLDPFASSPVAESGSITVTNSPAGSTGDVQFNTSGNFAADDNNFFWDATNHRLGIGTNAPAVALDVRGAGAFTGLVTASSATVTNLVTAGSFSGVGTAITALNASSLASGTVATGRISGSYTGITTVGTLASLTVSGTVAAGGGGNTVYYCSGSTAGTFDGNLARGNSNAGACAGGTWTATSLRVD